MISLIHAKTSIISEPEAATSRGKNEIAHLILAACRLCNIVNSLVIFFHNNKFLELLKGFLVLDFSRPDFQPVQPWLRFQSGSQVGCFVSIFQPIRDSAQFLSSRHDPNRHLSHT